MAKFEKTISGDMTEITDRIYHGIRNSSISASFEDSSSFVSGNARCEVMVFERYSFMGGNRVSMSVTLFDGGDGQVHVSAITAGGSQAVLWKVNTLGEEAFLDELRKLL